MWRYWLVFSFYRNEKTSVKQESNLKWVHIFSFRVKFTPIWNCYWWQIKYQWTYCLVYVFSESPFKMVSRIRSLLKFTPQVYCSSLPVSFTPPIWNCHWWWITYWQTFCLIYVFRESPFKTVGRIRSLLKFTCKFYPPSSNCLRAGHIQVYYQCHLQVYCQSHLQVNPPLSDI